MKDYLLQRSTRGQFIAQSDIGILCERLCLIARVFEAMAAREPEGHFTGWMADSEFTFVSEWDHGQSTTGTVKMGDVANTTWDLYPENRIPILREELDLGSVHSSKIAGLKSLSSL